jgi:basic secretory peptidase family protein
VKAPLVHPAGAVVLFSLLASCTPPDDPVSTENASEALVTNGPAGTVSAQYTDSPVGEGVANLMDGKTTTKYLTYHSTGWVKWKGSSAFKALTYGLTSANDVPGRDPRSWNLQGSTDGVAWTTLDSRSGQTFTARYQKKSYTIVTPASYVYYKLNITAVADPTLAKLQLAEWDLAGASCTSSPIIPYLRVDSGAWQQTSTVTVKAGQTVKFGPQPIVTAGWSWSGPSGFAASTREVTITNVQAAKAGTYLVTFTNASGCKSSASFSIALSSPVTADWSTFVYPTVTFTDNATALEGSTIFHNAIPDVIGMMKEQCLAICKQIYANNLDPRVNFTKLNLQLNDDPNGVAWKAGAPPEITIGISAQYIANFFHNNGNDPSLVLKEVRGILAHEGTHGYQWEPKNCGAYDGSSTFWAFIEGEADGVRAELTNWTPPRHPTKGGSWMDGYNRTGFFLAWCKDSKKPTFLIELNHAARDMPTFTWDAAFQQILGISVQQAWNEYQATLP